MFTGIIREVGTVERLARAGGVAQLAVRAPRTTAAVDLLESVAINGVCLSVVGRRQGCLVFEVIPETLRATALGALRPGTPVHVEPSLSVSDRLNGHLVFGHVDGTGTIARRQQRDGELVLTVRVEPRLRALLVPKGPVAVDGVSLTVGPALGPRTFTLHLIPETLRQTVLGARRVGARVNIELDYLAKLVRQFLRSR